MSTVTITDLTPGLGAASADLNATSTSWVNATAAGQIGANNVRMEGIDRRSLSGAAHVVATAEMVDNTIVQSSTPTAGVASVAYAQLTLGGATDIKTPARTIATASQVIVHASVSFEGAARSIVGATPELYLILQSSTNGGGAWSSLAGTTQVFQMREIGLLCDRSAVLDTPAIVGTATWAHLHVHGGVSTEYRVAFKTTIGTIIFTSGIIFLEVLGK